jgi:thiamine-monophosphate kinase
MNEPDFLALLRPLATHPAARGLLDDAAVLGDLVLTHDVLVKGVHFRPDDAPVDVAWKLLAVNLSDLAAKGAVPVGVLLGYPLSTTDWDSAFVRGFADALRHFNVPLFGGDTVKGPRVFSLTAIGRAAIAPSRSGARAGDALWVTGVIGSAGFGLRVLDGHEMRIDRNPSGWVAEGTKLEARDDLRERVAEEERRIAAYLRPTPRLAEGQALAPIVHAMMDVSDGLLIDAQRMAAASGLALSIDLDAVPYVGERMAAVTAGDDYELLFAGPADLALPVAATRIGSFASGQGLTLFDRAGPVALPPRLGWEHNASP